MYDFLRSPKWLAGHVLVLVGIVTFVSLGLWQLRRYEEVTSRNDLIESRMALPLVSLEDLLQESAATQDLIYRRVAARGVYEVEREVVLAARSYGGRPGHHLLTPLLLDDGRAVIVDRGWVPLELDEAPVAQARPAADGAVVEVSGILFPPDPASAFGPRTPPGRDDLLGRVDLQRLAERVDAPLVDVYLLAQDQQPPVPGDLPLAAEPPALDDGPHLSYAIQWFFFSLVVLVGYPVLLRHTARERRSTSSREARVHAGVGS